jgi:DNA-binding SARP family transcriptional activator
MRFGLLGPLEVVDDGGAPVDVGGRQPRLVLAVLLAAGGRLVTADALADELWGDERPATAMGTLQSTVSRLRRRFGAGPTAPRLLWEDPGYRLDVAGAEVDFLRFEALADEGRALLDAGRPAEAREVLLAADALWRGPALLEFLDRDFATGLATRLEERRLAATEDRVDADLRLGRAAAVAGELAELVRAHPLRERLRAHLALALYRSGRQADALRALEDARRTLRDELGVDPSRPLRELEAAILGHDPAIDLAEPPAAAPAPAAAAPAPAPARPRGMIGRRDELAEVLAALDEAAAEARVVVVEGEPGIGKTRLAEELRAEAAARGGAVAWGRGYEGGAAPALWPWLVALRDLAGGAGTGDPSLDALLATDAPEAATPTNALQFERFEAVARFLERTAAAAGVVVVVLDDLQWADETSLDLLSFLSARLGRGVLLLLTMRRLEVGRNDALTEALAAVARRPGSRRLHLRRLPREDTVALVEALLGPAVDRDVAVAIHARSDGNPFYATELARLVLDDERTDLAGVVPAGVGDVIRRRLAHLPEPTRELLAVGAVLGRDVELGLLTRTSGLSTDFLLDRLEPAVVHRLLLDVPDRPSTFRFCHALVREVLVEDLSSLRRARLHLRAAEAMEATGVGDDDAEVLAEHLWRAVPVGGGQRAASALEHAADVAIRRSALGSAEQLLRRAVELRRSTATSPADEEAELLAIHRLLAVARARRYFAGATTPQLIDRAKELAARTGRDDVLLDVLWVETSAAATAARVADAAPLAAALARVALASDDPDVQAFGHLQTAVQAWQEGRITDACRSLDLAADRRAAGAPVDPSLEFAGERTLLVQLFRAQMRALAGDVAPSVAAMHRLLDLTADSFVLTEVAGFAAVLGEAVDDLGLAERAGLTLLAVDPNGDFSYYGGHALMGLAAAMARRGEVDEGRRLFTEARARYLAVGGGAALPTHDASWAVAAAGAGCLDEAESAIATARETLERLGERWNEPVVLRAEAVVAAARGDREAAAARLAEAVAVATAQGAHGLARLAERVAADLGVDLPDAATDRASAGRSGP